MDKIVLEYKDIKKVQEEIKKNGFKHTKIKLNEPMFIPYKFITLNEYIKIERTPYKGYMLAAKIKKQETHVAKTYLNKYPKIQTPCKLKFTWILKNKNTDPDNIAFAKKFILDGMIKAGLIENDNLNHIQGFQDEFKIDKNKVGVYIETI